MSGTMMDRPAECSGADWSSLTTCKRNRDQWVLSIQRIACACNAREAIMPGTQINKPKRVIVDTRSGLSGSPGWGNGRTKNIAMSRAPMSEINGTKARHV